MDNEVRIKLSMGVVAVIILHAIVLAGLQISGIHQEYTQGRDTKSPAIVLPSYQADRNFVPTFDRPAGQFAPAHPKLDELKQAGGQSQISGLKSQISDLKTQCPDGSCQPVSLQTLASQYGARIVNSGGAIYASLPNGQVWAATGISQTRSYAGPNAYMALAQDMQLGLATPWSVNPMYPPSLTPRLPEFPGPTMPAPHGTQPNTAGSRKFQLALFIDGSAKSLELQRWFAQDQTLSNLRANCETQVYQSNNPLYRSRYAAIVPPDQFPAVLLLAPDGGHIHAAGGSMLPGTAGELRSDLQKSVALARSVESAEPVTAAGSGALRERAYNWDTGPIPQRFQPIHNSRFADCPDGYCPDGSCDDESNWQPKRPGGGLLPLLGPNAPDHSAIVWMSNTEIITIGLVLLITGIVAFNVLRRA